MAKLSLRGKLEVEWTNVYLEAQRALNYLEEKKTIPVKAAHKILATSVKKSIINIMNLT